METGTREILHKSNAPPARPAVAPLLDPPVRIHHVIDGPNDPRWILASRTAEALDGSTLPPEKRQRLCRLGTRLGLTLFDSSLILAIVQDRARRGIEPSLCPAAGQRELEMVRRPGPFDHSSGHGWMIAMIVAVVLTAELLALRLWLGW